jgi:hypothetical protein
MLPKELHFRDGAGSVNDLARQLFCAGSPQNFIKRGPSLKRTAADLNNSVALIFWYGFGVSVEKMTSTPNDYLYLSQDDLYRFGNSTSPRLDHVRSNDVDLYVLDGVPRVRANGKGISLLTELEAARKPGWLWRIPKSTALPPGLALNPDRPGHFALCPVSDMTVDRYRALLSELARHCLRVRKQ